MERKSNPIIPVAVLACCVLVALVLIGALGTWVAGDVAGRLANADAALRTLEDTADQTGAAVCVGALNLRSCNVGQEQAKASERNGATTPLEWFAVGIAGCAVIFLSASVSYRMTPDLWWR